MPVDIRSLFLATLAVLGSVFMLHWASAVFIPLMLGMPALLMIKVVCDHIDDLKPVGELQGK